MASIDGTWKDRIRSILWDAEFVASVVQDLREAGAEQGMHTVVVANLRCGLWYLNDSALRQADHRLDVRQESGVTHEEKKEKQSECVREYETCYFKSTDGHYNWLVQGNCISSKRLNLHLLTAAGDAGILLLVDATKNRKKLCPDSFTRTVPLWCCILNRISWLLRIALGEEMGDSEEKERWWRLRLPDYAEKELPRLAPLMDRMVVQTAGDMGLAWILSGQPPGGCLGGSGQHIRDLTKPLVPFWVNRDRKLRLKGEERPWFTPVVLLSASSSSACFPGYMPGAPDDEESWACGMTANIFWQLYCEFRATGLGGDVREEKFAKQFAAYAAEEVEQHGNCGGKWLQSRPIANFREEVAENSSVTWGIPGRVAMNVGSKDVWELIGAFGLVVSLETDASGRPPSSWPGQMVAYPVGDYKKDRLGVERALRATVPAILDALGECQPILFISSTSLAVAACFYVAVLAMCFDHSHEVPQMLEERRTRVRKEDIRSALVVLSRQVPGLAIPKAYLKSMNRYFMSFTAS